MFRFTLLCALLCLAHAPLFSQEATDVRFGQVPAADVQMMDFPADTTADAVVLHDMLQLSIEDNDREYVLTQIIHRRVKLLKQSSFDRANIELRYLKGVQKIQNLKAMIILPNGEQIELKNQDFVREELSNDINSIRFTFPQVEEGAIIEYRYLQSGGNISQLPTYYFQEDIPVVKSELKAKFRSEFSYLALSNAFDLLCINDIQKLRSTDRQYNYSGGIRSIQYHYAMCDLPAFKSEPYVNNQTDYLPKAYFQLSNIYSPSTGWRDVLETWDVLATKFLNNANIGRRLDRRNQIARIAESIGPLQGNNQQEKAQFALDAVNQQMSWNEYYNIGTQKSLLENWEDRIGNSAALNMILIGILRANDIETEPVLVGLRNSGVPIMEFPVARQFDHLMLLAQLDGTPTIIDANGSAGIVGLPRVATLNGAAWVLSNDHQRWINVEVPMMAQIHNSEIELSENGMADINTKSICRGYYRFSALADLAEEGPEPEGPIFDYFSEKFPESEFVDRQILEIEKVDDPLQIELQLRAPIGQAIDDYIYLSPVLINVFESTLVENDSRHFPIDFAFPWRKILIANFHLPEGYVIDEMPENRSVQSTGGGIKAHLYFEQKENNQLSINFMVRVGKSFFEPSEYDALREILNQVIEMQESVVVLKRE